MKRIKLTQGKYALVDKEDFEWLNQWKWYYHRNPKDTCGYACRNIGKRPNRGAIKMHRQIMKASRKQVVDHINRCGIDNRKQNLRIASYFQSSQNKGVTKRNVSCGFKGVSKTCGKYWIARITVNGSRFYLGTFPSAEEANNAYVSAAKKYHKEFCYVR